MKLPTQSDIARIAGVSRATVSYVLSGRAGGAIKVTEDTRRRVLKVSEDLGYQPNAVAQSLRLSVTGKIGITIPDLSNPHLQTILCGAAEEAQKNDYNLLLVCTEMRPEYERIGIRELLRRSIDGLILLPTYVNILEEEYQLLTKRRSPIVVAGNYYDHLKELDTVIPGHDEGAVLMMRHLLGLGHRRIGLIFGVIRKPLGNERLLMYKKMLEEEGLQLCDSLVIQTGITYQDGCNAANILFNQDPPPTAILAINDVLALGAMHAALQRGLHIPEDISIAGFDDNNYSAFLNPPLTTVDVNAHEIGVQCIRLVIQRIEYPERPYINHRIQPQLKIRGSTAPVESSVQIATKQEKEVLSTNQNLF
jgi:LacI family transcriptional regulator